jgi:DNA-binding transcriptional LysR family regulator
MDRLAAMDAFVRVVDAGSFSGAAKQLRVGQSAVSKAIAQLEGRLRVRLLLRSTRGWRRPRPVGLFMSAPNDR